MSPVPAGPGARAERLAPVAALCLPVVLAALFAGTGMGFYDSPELAASAAGVGVTHPPGHPLWVALAAVAALVPVGTIPYRVALLSGAALGAVAWLAYGVARRLVERLGARAPVAPLLALGAALAAVLGPGVMRQATRVEVYALAALLAVAPLALAAAEEHSLAWRARWAVLAVGLGGANHHFIALTTAPLALWVVVDRLRARPSWRARAKTAGVLAALGALALAPYALLPLRADAVASLPRVRTAGDFVWTVTARAFQKNAGAGVPGTAGEHLLDVIEWLGASLTAVGLVAALGGTYIGLRAGARRDVLRLLLVVAPVCGARAALGFVRDNPDAAGYLAPAVVALAVLGAAFTAGVAQALGRAPPPPEGPSRTARVALAALLVAAPALVPLYQVVASAGATAVDRSHAPEAMAEALLRPLPPRAVALAYAPETVFRARYAQLVEGTRPDVTVVPVPFVTYPGMTNALLERDGALLPLVRDYLAHGSPRAENLQALAVARALRVELDPLDLRPDYVPLLLPRGLLAEVRTEPTTPARVRAEAAAHFAALDALNVLLAEEPGSRERWREFVLWRNFNDALFFAARGVRDEARRSARRALAINPSARELVALDAALADGATGPLDITPFLP